MANTRILIICNYSSLYGGNFIASLRKLSSLLLAKMYNVVFLFPDEAADKNWYQWLSMGFEVSTCSFSHLDTYLKAKKRTQFDVIYTHFVSSLNVLKISKIFKKSKIVMHIHSDFSNGRDTTFWRKFRNCFYSFLLRNVVEIFVGGSIGNTPKSKKMFVVPNGLCLERDYMVKQNIRYLYGLASDDIIVELFGWSPYTKGVDIAIRAFLFAKNKSSSKLKLLIITDEQNRTFDFIKSIFGHIPDGIILAKPSKNVFDFHESSDIYLSSSRSEGFSYAALEALYCGLPILSSDIKGTQWVSAFQNVYLFKSEDWVELGKKLLLISQKIHCFKRNGNKDLVGKLYSIDDWCLSIANILEE